MNRENVLKAFQLTAAAAAGLYAYLWVSDPKRYDNKKKGV